MKKAMVVLIALATLGSFASLVSLPAHGGEQDAIFVSQIPPGYRDWRLISIAHEEGNLNSLGAILGTI
jgi:hypothetical protein